MNRNAKNLVHSDVIEILPSYGEIETSVKATEYTDSIVVGYNDGFLGMWDQNNEFTSSKLV